MTNEEREALIEQIADKMMAGIEKRLASLPQEERIAKIQELNALMLESAKDSEDSK